MCVSDPVTTFSTSKYRRHAFQMYISVKKNDKQKLQLRLNQDTRGDTLIPYNNSKAQEEEKALFFPGKDSVNKKPCSLCLVQPSQLPFPL